MTSSSDLPPLESLSDDELQLRWAETLALGGEPSPHLSFRPSSISPQGKPPRLLSQLALNLRPEAPSEPEPSEAHTATLLVPPPSSAAAPFPSGALGPGETLRLDQADQPLVHSQLDSTAPLAACAETIIEGAPKAHKSSPSTEPVDIGKNYRLLEELGRGGMGIVYRARQQVLEREVAVKRIQKRDPELEARFISEALVTGQLDHPNIVPIYDLSCGPQGELFLAMKLVDGQSWRQLLKNRKSLGRDLEDELKVLIEVCHALEFAHSRGVAHLDLKPENVMLGAFGEVLVMDWGLAVDFRDHVGPAASRAESGARALPRAELTQPCGTPCYMPPELSAGEGNRVGPWTDTYLLGGILFELASGQPPHTGATLIEVLKSSARGRTPDFSKTPRPVSAELRPIINRALAAQPKERYESVASFRADLEALMKHRQSRVLEQRANEVLELCRREPHKPGEAQRQRNAHYARYSEAAAGFKQALTLWAENRAAAEGAFTARLEFGHFAAEQGDFGLAESQLESLAAELESLAAKFSDQPDRQTSFEELEQRIREGQARRLARQRRLKTLGAAVALLLLCTLAALVFGFTEAHLGRQRAEEAMARAELERRAAIDAHAEADSQRQRALIEAARARALKNESEFQAATARAQGAIGLLEAGRSLASAQHWRTAATRYLSARDALKAEGLADEAARVGLWYVQQRRPEPTLTGPSEKDPATAIASIPGTGLLLTGHQSGSLALRRSASGEVLARLRAQNHELSAIALHPSEPQLATLHRLPRDGIRLWTLEQNPKPALRSQRIIEFPESATALAFYPRAKALIVASHEGQLWFTNLEAQLWRPILSWPVSGSINSIALHPNGDILACASFGKDGYNLHLVSLKAARVFKSRNASVKLAGLCFDSLGQQLYFAGNDGYIHVLNAETLQNLHKLGPHEDAARSLILSPDDRYALSAGADDRGRLWDLERQRELAQFPLEGGCSALELNEDLIFGSSNSGLLQAWTLQPRAWQRRLRNFKSHPTRSLDVGAEGQIFALDDNGRSLFALDAREGRVLARPWLSEDHSYAIACRRDQPLTLLLGQQEKVIELRWAQDHWEKSDFASPGGNILGLLALPTGGWIERAATGVLRRREAKGETAWSFDPKNSQASRAPMELAAETSELLTSTSKDLLALDLKTGAVLDRLELSPRQAVEAIHWNGHDQSIEVLLRVGSRFQLMNWDREFKTLCNERSLAQGLGIWCFGRQLFAAFSQRADLTIWSTRDGREILTIPRARAPRTMRFSTDESALYILDESGALDCLDFSAVDRLAAIAEKSRQAQGPVEAAACEAQRLLSLGAPALALQRLRSEALAEHPELSAIIKQSQESLALSQAPLEPAASKAESPVLNLGTEVLDMALQSENRLLIIARNFERRWERLDFDSEALRVLQRTAIPLAPRRGMSLDRERRSLSLILENDLLVTWSLSSNRSLEAIAAPPESELLSAGARPVLRARGAIYRSQPPRSFGAETEIKARWEKLELSGVAAIAANDHALFVLGNDSRLEAWSTAHEKLWTQATNGSSPALAILSTNRIALGIGLESIEIRRSDNGELIETLRIQPERRGVRKLVELNETLIALMADNSLRLWKLSLDAPPREIPAPTSGSSAIQALALVGDRLLLGDWNGELRIHDLQR